MRTFILVKNFTIIDKKNQALFNTGYIDIFTNMRHIYMLFIRLQNYLHKQNRLLVGGRLIEMSTVVHVIDCDENPKSLDGCEIEEHKKGGQLEWNPDEIKLWLVDGQEENPVGAHELRAKLQDQKLLNANVLYYLLENSYLIPIEWQNKQVFFWGTIYRSSNGISYVLSMYWSCGYWSKNMLPIIKGRYWDNRSPAIISRPSA